MVRRQGNSAPRDGAFSFPEHPLHALPFFSLSFTTHSPAFRVTVEPTYASEPEFLLEPTSVTAYEGERAYFNAAAIAYDD